MENTILKFEQICEEATDKCKQGCRINAFIVTPDNRLIFSTSTHYLFISALHSSVKLLAIKTKDPITCISSNEKGGYILVSFNNKCVKLLDISKLYEIWKGSDQDKETDIKPAEVYSYEHSTIITSSVLNPDYGKREKVSFAFADINGNIFIHTQATFPFPSKSTQVSSKEQCIETLWWGHGRVAWASHSNITIYDVSSNEKNVIFYSKTINSQRTCFMYIEPNILCATFDTFFLQVKLDHCQNPIIVNTSKTILTMATSGSSTLEILRDKDSEDVHLIVDQKTDLAEEKLPCKVDPSNQTFYLLSTVDKQLFICVIGNNIFTVTFATWLERLKSFTVVNESDLYAKFGAMCEFFNDEERLTNVLSTANHFLQNNSFNYAVKVCAENLKPTQYEWETAMKEFKLQCALHIIAPAVPVEKLLDKTPMILELILELLEHDTNRFFEVFSCLFIGNASKTIENIKGISESLIPPLKEKAKNDRVFNIPLLHIYQHRGDHEAALNCGLLSGYNKFFEYVVQHKQYQYCLNHIGPVFNVYGERFLEFLILNRELLTPRSVISKIIEGEKQYRRKIDCLPANDTIGKFFEEENLKNQREYLYKYMQKLRHMGIPIPDEFVTTMAILYIEHRSPETLDVLHAVSGSDYKIVKEAAHEHKMYREEALLLLGGGKMMDGMNIHLQYIQSPREAVDYAMKCDDDNVWKELLKQSRNDEKFRTYILGNLTNLQNYITFFESIPPDLETSAWSGIENRMNEFVRQMKIVNKIESIVSASAFDKYKSEVKKARRGKRIFDVSMQPASEQYQLGNEL